jgi:NADH-quinone oxidoreductase subunit N
MAGIPPMAGFLGKILIMKAVVDSQMIWLAAAMAFAMVLSIVYSLIILRTVFIAPPRAGAPSVAMVSWEGSAVLALALLLIVFGMVPQPVMGPIGDAMAALLQTGAPPESMIAAITP